MTAPPAMLARVAVFLLYLPMLAAVASLLPKCVVLLMRGQAAGYFGFLYGAALLVAGRRAARVVRGGVTSLWLDGLLALAADVLLALLLAPDVLA